MKPDEQLERQAQSQVALDGEEFPYCLACGLFVYLDYMDRCGRCGGRSIAWREIPIWAPPRRTWSRPWVWILVVILVGGIMVAMWRIH